MTPRTFLAATSLAALLTLPRAAVAGDTPQVSPPPALTGPQVGTAAPAFDVETIEGKHVTLDSFKGKTLVINAWGTWCPPCREETPDLIASATKLMKSGVEFLGVDSTEAAPVVRAFAVAKGVPYPLAIDGDKSFAKAYDIQEFPTTFVIDPQGIVRARYIDVLAPKQLFELVDAAQHGRDATLESPLQSKIDATLAAVPHDFGSDAAAAEAAAKKADAAIDDAEKLLDDSDSASGNSTDFLRTRAEEAAVRDAAIAALVNFGTAVDDKSLLPRLNGDAARDRENWNEALAAYTAALAIDPKNEDALSGTAQAAARLEKYDVAADADAKLAALEPKDSSDLVELARAQAKAANKDAAGATFARAIALANQNLEADPTNASSLRALAYAQLYAGRFEADSSSPDRARTDFAAALTTAERLPESNPRHDMYVEESQEAMVALSLGAARAEPSVSLVPWTGPGLPGSIPNTIKYRLVVAGTPGHNIALAATDVPSHWVASFCSDRVCAPFRVSILIPESGVKVVEFQLVPPAGKVPAPKVRVTGSDGPQRFSATT
jgi:peroxiredoxin